MKGKGMGRAAIPHDEEVPQVAIFLEPTVGNPRSCRACPPSPLD